MRAVHGCPSQMNCHFMLSNSKLKSDSELIWLSSSSNFSSFVGDNPELMGVYYIMAMLIDCELIGKFK